MPKFYHFNKPQGVEFNIALRYLRQTLKEAGLIFLKKPEPLYESVYQWTIQDRKTRKTIVESIDFWKAYQVAKSGYFGCYSSLFETFVLTHTHPKILEFDGSETYDPELDTE